MLLYGPSQLVTGAPADLPPDIKDLRLSRYQSLWKDCRGRAYNQNRKGDSEAVDFPRTAGGPLLVYFAF